jgi:hypothetical protein
MADATRKSPEFTTAVGYSGLQIRCKSKRWVVSRVVVVLSVRKAIERGANRRPRRQSIRGRRAAYIALFDLVRARGMNIPPIVTSRLVDMGQSPTWGDPRGGMVNAG